MKLAVACCGTLLIFFSSCAKDRSEIEAQRLEATPPSPHAPLEGSLEYNVLKIQDDVLASPCDKNVRDAQLELARELDRRQQEIKNLALATNTTPPNYKKVPMGEVFVLEAMQLSPPTPGWQSYNKSWKSILEKYQALKGTPTDLQWRALNARVKGILSDDRKRVTYASNMTLNKDSGPSVLAMRSAVQNCFEDPNCGQVDLSAHADFIKAQPRYAYYSNALTEAKDPADWRKKLENFKNLLNRDAWNYKFTPNKSLKWANAETLVLPVDGSPFERALPQLQSYIESIWTAHGRTLKIEWAKADPAKDIYAFLYSPEPGGRAFVNSTKKIIQLFPEEDTRAIAHEVGHVLGFIDEYYTSWNEQTCEYTVEYREDNLMSDHSTGAVLPEHWEKLQREYPLTMP